MCWPVHDNSMHNRAGLHVHYIQNRCTTRILTTAYYLLRLSIKKFSFFKIIFIHSKFSSWFKNSCHLSIKIGKFLKIATPIEIIFMKPTLHYVTQKSLLTYGTLYYTQCLNQKGKNLVKIFSEFVACFGPSLNMMKWYDEKLITTIHSALDLRCWVKVPQKSGWVFFCFNLTAILQNGFLYFAFPKLLIIDYAWNKTKNLSEILK